MSVLSLPPSMVPVRQRWQEERQDIELRSVFGSQILQPVPPVWATELEFDDRAEWLSGDIKALWMQLAGGNQLEAYDMARPAPLGTMRGTLTLVADVAQGATSMQLVAANNNLLTFPESLEQAAWGKSAMLPLAAGTDLAPDGTSTMETLVPTTSSAEHYVRRTLTNVAAGQELSSSFHVGAAGYTHARLRLVDASAPTNGFFATFDLSNGSTSQSNAGIGTVTARSMQSTPNGTFRIGVTGKVNNVSVTSVFADLFVLPAFTGTSIYAGNGTSGLKAWGGKIENGAQTDYGYGKTLLAGDLLGIGSGTKQQVVMVTQDATSTGQGNITVSFEHPLRNAFSAGQAVTWDKPKALFRMRQNRPGWDYERSRAKGLKLDLVESVYA
jgi:hypothetical protein